MSRYLLPQYFASRYFFAIDPCQLLATTLASTNDFDVLSRVETILRETGEFTYVAFPERPGRSNIPAQLAPSVAILPLSWKESSDSGPDNVLRVVQFEIVLTIRSVDSRAGYQRLMRLASIVQNRIDGSDLGGFTLGGRTRLAAGQLDQSPSLPEQKLTLFGECAYSFSRSVGRV